MKQIHSASNIVVLADNAAYHNVERKMSIFPIPMEVMKH
jgi:hypothetical protein